MPLRSGCCGDLPPDDLSRFRWDRFSSTAVRSERTSFAARVVITADSEPSGSGSLSSGRTPAAVLVWLPDGIGLEHSPHTVAIQVHVVVTVPFTAPGRLDQLDSDRSTSKRSEVRANFPWTTCISDIPSMWVAASNSPQIRRCGTSTSRCSRRHQKSVEPE